MDQLQIQTETTKNIQNIIGQQATTIASLDAQLTVAKAEIDRLKTELVINTGASDNG